ncbi:MAG: hypothetical protein KDA89_20600, partial [Planctomycetaceae bacterium]|nr:hypothetical protein [Planctomycetaceae bacterium]
MVTPDQDEPDASKNEPFIPWEVDAEIRDLIRQVARQLLGGFPLVRRWNETDDVCQEAEIRLQRALSNVQAESRR